MGLSPLASERRESPPQSQTLAAAPLGFFMTVRDVAFWIRSWRADSHINRVRQQHGAASAFDSLYAGSKDPFGAELPQYRYQQRKYNSLLSMLPRRRYQNVLDIGCGLGAFTRKIAPFSEAVLGTDISEVAITQARELSSDHPNVTYSVQAAMESPGEHAAFDLIVLADTLYYTESLTVERIESISSHVASKLMPGGLLLLVNHYFFGVDSASRATRAAHDVFRGGPLLDCVAEHRRAFFLATILQRADLQQAA
jgi:SAM-dependent methyltransferase